MRSPAWPRLGASFELFDVLSAGFLPALQVNAVESARLYTPLTAAISRAAALEASRQPEAAAFRDCAARLIAAGADLQLASKDGRTPLHVAAEAGSQACTEMLLRAGAQLNAADSYGRMPLSGAAVRGQRQVVLYLLAQGAVVASAELVSGVPVELACYPPCCTALLAGPTCFLPDVQS